jgi:hypothetical protein
MIEREMDNRGSKSVMYKNITVKEQRVYGNYFGLVNPRLRCILRGLERDFQIKNYYVLSSTTRVNVVMGRVSNQINRSVVSYSTLTTETKKKKALRIKSKQLIFFFINKKQILYFFSFF